ncbi:MAG: hypothetical protein K0R01_546 [Mycobacterium sp.]|jgi:hypothetical protein|nr:hypothetical protein [Mycobacterium sp.]
MTTDDSAQLALAPAPAKWGRWLATAIVASSLFLAATWALAVHGDSHEFPVVPSSTFDSAVHEPIAR